MAIRTGALRACLITALAALAACSDGLSPAAPRSLSLSVAAAPTDSTGPVTAQPSDTGMVQSDGTHTLTLSKVQLVVRRIELAPADPGNAGAPADTVCSEGDVDGEHDSQWHRVGHCEELKVGPILVDVPLDGQVQKVFSVQLPVGTYRGVEMQIHAPDHRNQSDRDFLQANPGFDSVSVRAEGTFDGAPFMYTARIEARQRQVLDPPVAVTVDSGPTNITLHLDVSTWFVGRDGTLIDPSTATHDTEAGELVRWNVMRSLQTFEDNNRDGVCDGGGHGEQDRHGGHGG